MWQINNRNAILPLSRRFLKACSIFSSLPQSAKGFLSFTSLLQYCLTDPRVRPSLETLLLWYLLWPIQGKFT